MSMKKRQWYLAGPEAAQIVRDHEAAKLIAYDTMLTVTGLAQLKPDEYGSIVLTNGRFYGYQRTETQKLLPGFRMSQKREDYSRIAVLNLRTSVGKSIGAQLAKIKMPENEDLTKALCGDWWCFIGMDVGSVSTFRAYTFHVERVGEKIFIGGVAGGLAPAGCTIVDGPLKAIGETP